MAKVEVSVGSTSTEPEVLTKLKEEVKAEEVK